MNQLIDIYNTFCKAIDEGKEVRVLFCDVSKAYHRVRHTGLLYKLNRAGISGPFLSWFTNYLYNREQRVVLPGTSSSWKLIKAGVPQGSILDPLLSIIYINDIVEDIHCNIRLFADNTSLFIIVDDPTEAAQLLNSDMEKSTSGQKSGLSVSIQQNLNPYIHNYSSEKSTNHSILLLL